ncbi:hypothetical protein Q5752_002379 [Cryptotrichosporon argae]
MKPSHARLALAPPYAASAARRRADAVAPLLKPFPRIHPSLLLPPPFPPPFRDPPHLLDPNYPKTTSTPSAPFAGALFLLAEHSKARMPVEARTIVRAVDVSVRDAGAHSSAAPWSAELLNVVLKLPMDRWALLALVRPVAQCMRALDPKRAVELLAALTRRASQLNAQALLATLVDMFLDTIEGADVGPKMLLYLYRRMISAFEGFCSSPAPDVRALPTGPSTRMHKARLPHPALAQVSRLTADLIDRLDRLPSTSDLDQQVTVATHAGLLRLLFRPHMLSVDNMDRLLAYCDVKGIPVEREYWRSCVELAISHRDPRATEFLRNLERATPSKPGTLSPQIFESGVVYSEEVSPADGLATPVRPGCSPLRARLSPTLADALAELEPLIQASSQDAWHLLALRSTLDSSVPATSLLDIANAMPDDCVTALTMTPIMHGLIRRQVPQQAMEIWRDLVLRFRRAKTADKTRFLDAAALSVAAEAVYALHGLAGAIGFVDRLAARPLRTSRRGVMHSVPIDSAALNMLLKMCDRAARPSVVFRLWDAAKRRWGVEHDGASLAILIDCARFAGAAGDDPELDSVRARLRLLADGFRSTRTDDDKGKLRLDALATGGVRALLDPPRHSWRAEYGPTRPAAKARELFRAIAFANWPELEAVKSPLDQPGFVVRSLTQLFIADPAETPAHDSAIGVSIPQVARRLPEQGWHLSLVPTPSTFQAYISLLAHLHLEAEIPTALAWARHIGVTPTRKCLTTALLAVDRAEGPRTRLAAHGSRVVLLRDDEVLRRWLVEWLGDQQVPAEEEVAALSREIMARRAEAAAIREARRQRLGQN